MTDDSRPDAARADEPGQPAGQAVGPRIQVHAQYLKDLSSEKPNAPRSLMSQEQPKIEVSVDVGAQALGENQFEVELKLNARASRSDHTAFVSELVYGGVFTLHNVDPTSMKAVCLIECPRIMFPFARRILADATRDGGYPPLMLEPIDFAMLFRQQEMRRQEQGADDAADGRFTS